jgi:hypothetical protein
MRAGGRTDRQKGTKKVIGTRRGYKTRLQVVTLPSLDTEQTNYAYANAVF